MAGEPFEFELYGISHTPDQLPKFLQLIDQLAKNGIKVIGLEPDVNAVKIILRLRAQHRLNPRFAKILQGDVLKAEDAILFSMKQYAAKRGMQVVPIEGSLGGEAAVRWAIERINARFGPRTAREIRKNGLMKVIGDELNAAYLDAQSGKFDSIEHVSFVLRTQQMERRIRRLRPQVIIAGLAHAFVLARSFNIPPARTHWVPSRILNLFEPGIRQRILLEQQDKYDTMRNRLVQQRERRKAANRERKR